MSFKPLGIKIVLRISYNNIPRFNVYELHQNIRDTLWWKDLLKWDKQSSMGLHPLQKHLCFLPSRYTVFILPNMHIF